MINLPLKGELQEKLLNTTLCFPVSHLGCDSAPSPIMVSLSTLGASSVNHAVPTAADTSHSTYLPNLTLHLASLLL